MDKLNYKQKCFHKLTNLNLTLFNEFKSMSNIYETEFQTY